MPSLKDHQALHAVKLLNIGDSGAGKTGALAALINAGYRMFILDYDNGLDPLREHVDPKKLDNIYFESLQDKLKQSGRSIIPKDQPRAFVTGIGLLDKWVDSASGEHMGSVWDWSTDTILVMDSLTHMSLSALRYILAINGRSGTKPWQSDWGEAMSLVEETLQLLYCKDIGCHVIVNAHVTYHENVELGITKGLPTALGTKLPPKVPTYFNTMVLTATKGGGSNTKRVIYTRPQGLVTAKCPVVHKVDRELPIDTGLATIFKTLTGDKT